MTSRATSHRTVYNGVPHMWSSVPDDLLIPDAALPSQFQDIWHHTRAISPERALALAMLEQAVLDLHRYRFAKRRRQQRLYMEAYKWVASDDREWHFSFVNLCEALEFSPERLREQLLGDAVPGSPRTSSEAGEQIEEAA